MINVAKVTWRTPSSLTPPLLVHVITKFQLNPMNMISAVFMPRCQYDFQPHPIFFSTKNEFLDQRLTLSVFLCSAIFSQDIGFNIFVVVLFDITNLKPLGTLVIKVFLLML